MPQPRPISARVFLFVPGLVAAMLIGGCTDPLEKIDRRTDRLLAERSRALGGGAIAPSVGDRAMAERSRAGITSTNPPTVNPPASELGASLADPDRDVAQRLETYAAGSIPGADEAGTLSLSLEASLRLARAQGREHRTAEEAYILDAIALLAERHLWGPRFFNDISAMVGADGVDGRFDHVVELVNTLRVTQRLPYGGEVEARLVVNAAEQLRSSVTGRYTQSSALVLSGNIPLLRGAGTAARESRIQAERELIYSARDFERFRRTLLVQIAAEYFALIQSKSGIVNQERQIESLVRDNEATAAKVKAGTLRAFQRQITASTLSRARQTLASRREDYILRLDRFKRRLGLPIETPVDITGEVFEINEPDTTPAVAADRSLLFRLDLQNTRDRLDDARRAIKNARNQLLPDLDLSASVSVPTDPMSREGGLLIRPEETDYSAGVTLGLPLDRRIERLNVRRAIIGLERSTRDYEEFRDGVIIEARQAVRNIDLARFQLKLAEDQVRINRLGLEELRIRDDSDPQSIIDRLNDLLDAEDARDQAVADLRNAVLQSLLSTGQLRVEEDGSFIPLPGMADPGDDLGPNDEDPTEDLDGTDASAP